MYFRKVESASEKKCKSVIMSLILVHLGRKKNDVKDFDTPSNISHEFRRFSKLLLLGNLD